MARMACSCRFIGHGTGCCRRCFSWLQRNGLVVALVTLTAYHVTILQRPIVTRVKEDFEGFTTFCDVCSNEKTPEDNHSQEFIKIKCSENEKDSLYISGTRELTLKCKLKCYFKPMNNPLGVSPSKGKRGTTRGKEKIF